MNRERYFKCENPCDNYRAMHDIIALYADGENLDKVLNTYSDNRDLTPISKPDETEFLMNKYNDILKRFRSMTEEQIAEYSAKIENFAKYRRKMIRFGRVTTAEKLELLSKYDFFIELNKYFNWEDFDLSNHKISLFGRLCSDSFEMGAKKNAEHQIFISPYNQDLYKMLDIIRAQFEKSRVPYDIKYQKVVDSISRTDKIILNIDDVNFESTLDVLDDIYKKNTEICNRSQDTPIMSSKYNDWLGIVDLPKDKSFNAVRIDAIEKGVSQAIDEYLEKYRNKSCRYNGQNRSFDSIIKSGMSAVLLVSDTIPTMSKFKIDKEVRAMDCSAWYDVLGNFSKMYRKDNSDMKKDTETILGTISTSVGDFEITPCMIYSEYPKLAKVFQSIDKQFDILAGVRIQDAARDLGVDPMNFAFNYNEKQMIK